MTQKAVTAIGRRKTSTARVSLLPASDGEGKISVNKREFMEYFRLGSLQSKVRKPLEVAERVGSYNVTINVMGGGIAGQAGAASHGLSRALEKIEPELRAALKKNGLMTRDPRAVERKKPGRHKARKSTQFSKR